MMFSHYITLSKNIVTIEGQKYDVQQEAKEGYEPYEASDGTTMYRKPVGQGAPTDGPEDGAIDAEGEEPKPVEKDPLKQDAEPEKHPDLEGAKEIQEKMNGASTEESGKQDMSFTPGQDEPPDPTDPWDPKHQAGDSEEAAQQGMADHMNSVMEQYHQAAISEKLGDEKTAFEAREQARQMTEGFDGPEHDHLREQLHAAGYHDDAEHHAQQRSNIVSQAAGAHIDQMQQEADARDAKPTRDLKAPQDAGEAAAEEPPPEQEQKRPPVDTKTFEAGQERAKESARERMGTADTVMQPAADKPDQGRSDEGMDQGGSWSADEAQQAIDDIEAQHPDLKSKLEQNQKEAQKRAMSEFEDKSKEFEESTASAKKESKEYEQALKEHQEATAAHEKEMEQLQAKLKDVKDGKPTPDDKKLNKLKGKMESLRRQIKRHSLNAPEMDQKKADKAKAALDAHTSKKPIKRDNESDNAFENRVQDWEKKKNELKAQHEMIGKDHKSAIDAHKQEAKKLSRKLLDLQDAHSEEKNRVESAHQEALSAHEKKLKEAQSAVDAHEKKAESLPEEPKQPSAKEPEQTHRKPETAGEKAAHKDYTEQHRQMADNIASHLMDNEDLTPEQRQELMDLHEAHSYHANLPHVPTKEHKDESKKIMSRTKKHGADQHHDEVKAAKEQQAAKEQAKQEKESAKQEKQQAKQRENEPRPPENDMEQAKVHQHTSQARDAAANIRSHLENDDNISDEQRKVLESMADKLEEHSKLNTVPTKEQQSELKEAMKLTSDHSKQSFEEKNPEQPEQAPKQERKKTSGGASTGSLRRLYRMGESAGAAAGSAAASPHGGAGALGADALMAPGRGVASGGHWLFQGKRQSSEDSRPQANKALRLYIEEDQ